MPLESWKPQISQKAISVVHSFSDFASAETPRTLHMSSANSALPLMWHKFKKHIQSAFSFRGESEQTEMLDLSIFFGMCLVKCFTQNNSSAYVSSKNDPSYSQQVPYLLMSKAHSLIRQLERVVYRTERTKDRGAFPPLYL